MATTDTALARLIADKPPAWPYAVFTSVLVRRRNAVGDRLRQCVSGYQPRTGALPLSGQAYSSWPTGRYWRSPTPSRRWNSSCSARLHRDQSNPAADGAADTDALVSIANRLMDYHEEFLTHAETCLQTPVEPDVRVFVQDLSAFTLCPWWATSSSSPRCATGSGMRRICCPTPRAVTSSLDDVNLTISLPDGLTERISAHAKRFTRS